MTAFLANENISRTTVEILRENGHDVTWVAESFPSIKDAIIISLARLENRIIITFDADYGELIYGKRLNPPLGIVYLRLNSADPAEPARLILQYLSLSHDIFDGRFSVITEKSIRYKPL
jgi:predicted nuclease of predicted toxin-antitoxin system